MKMHLRLPNVPYIRQYETVIASVIITLMVIVLSFIFVIPNFYQGLTIHGKQKALEKQLIHLKDKERKIQSIDVEHYANAYVKLMTVLPETKDPVSIFETFDRLQNDTGVAITNIDFQVGAIASNSGETNIESYGRAFAIPVLFETLGSVEQSLDFLDKIHGIVGRLIRIRELDWQFVETGEVKMTVDALAFYYPYPKTIGSVDTPLLPMKPSYEALLKDINERVPDAVIWSDDTSEFRLGKENLFQ